MKKYHLFSRGQKKQMHTQLIKFLIIFVQ